MLVPQKYLLLPIKNNPEHIAIDLLSQAEHDELAQSILITDDIEFAEKVSNNINKYLKYIKRKEIAKKSWNKYGFIIVCENIDNAIDFSNQIAPEHLEMAIENSSKYLKK